MNIESLAAITTGPDGLVKMVVDNEDVARRVLQEADIPFSEHRVVSATLQDKPGALAELAEALANTGVNIEAIYLLQAEEGSLRFALAVDDPQNVQASVG